MSQGAACKRGPRIVLQRTRVWRCVPLPRESACSCLLYTSDAADELLCVDFGGRRIMKKKMFDSFQGDSLPTGKKSVGFSMEFASPDRTLFGDEVDVLVSSVEAALATRAGGILRRTRV